MENKELREKIYDVFGTVFGRELRSSLSPETDMDSISEWDSLRYFDLVFALEDEFDIEFSEEETTQLFQLRHIERIVSHILLDIPHDDVANTCYQLWNVKNSPEDKFNVVLLSGSSTREGLLPIKDVERLLQQKTDKNHQWYNCSTSGLVLAETLQLIESVGSSWRGVFLIGISPIILYGCGVSEFSRAANNLRFFFESPRKRKVLEKNGYSFSPDEGGAEFDLDLWVDRYLKDKNAADLIYNPYLYPTLKPWKDDKFNSLEDFLRYYNNSILNFEESFNINCQILDEIINLAHHKNMPLCFVEQTLHSSALSHLDTIGNINTKYNDFIFDYLRQNRAHYISANKIAGIEDGDFRDPAHIYIKQKVYTEAIIDETLAYLKGLK